jgi:hypothetical protein
VRIRWVFQEVLDLDDAILRNVDQVGRSPVGLAMGNRRRYTRMRMCLITCSEAIIKKVEVSWEVLGACRRLWVACQDLWRRAAPFPFGGHINLGTEWGL